MLAATALATVEVAAAEVVAAPAVLLCAPAAVAVAAGAAAAGAEAGTAPPRMLLRGFFAAAVAGAADVAEAAGALSVQPVSTTSFFALRNAVVRVVKKFCAFTALFVGAHATIPW